MNEGWIPTIVYIFLLEAFRLIGRVCDWQSLPTPIPFVYTSHARTHTHTRTHTHAHTHTHTHTHTTHRRVQTSANTGCRTRLARIAQTVESSSACLSVAITAGSVAVSTAITAALWPYPLLNSDPTYRWAILILNIFLKGYLWAALTMVMQMQLSCTFTLFSDVRANKNSFRSGGYISILVHNSTHSFIAYYVVN